MKPIAQTIRRSQYWLLLSVFIRASFLSLPALGHDEQDRPQTTLHFSPQPTESEISNARIFDEPILALNGNSIPSENKMLAEALTKYAARTNLDDFSSLTDFLAGFPQSTWNTSLLLHVGTEYYNYGYYSKALDAWEQSWQQFEHLTDPKAKAQADRALGELARMYSKLGRMKELGELLKATNDRLLTGPGTQLIHAALQALWMMQNRPDVCFRCGPLALDLILASGSRSKAANLLVTHSQSTTNGFSLSQVAQLSQRLGMNYQMAFRSPAAPLILPAVVHWKLGHYAALLKRDGNRVLVQDHTFHSTIWMSLAALNEEASGYFLIPPGSILPGWRTVPDQEANTIWGRGYTGMQDKNDTTPYAITTSGSSCGAPSMTSAPPGMTTYTMNTMLVSLTLNDRPVGYAPPVGPPVYFAATYNQLEANQPATFRYSNLGQKWTCNWIAYITDNPSSPTANVSYYVEGGGTLSFTGFNPTNQTYAVELMSHSLLLKTSSSSYELQFPDGFKDEFELPSGLGGTVRQVFLTQRIDPAGNIVQLNYDSQFRITNITDAIGQQTTFSYTNTTYSNAITSVTDPFHRTAYFQYNAAGLLSQITDVLGLPSQYTYGSNDFITNLATPYGNTTFSGGLTNGTSWLQATDPLGESELLEFNQTAAPENEPIGLIPRGMGTDNLNLTFRNSFYWDKKAYADGYGDFTKSKIYHWLQTDDYTTATGILESVKAALESRVWYNYGGQPDSGIGNIVLGTNSQPSAIGRVLDDGTSQIQYYQYNAFGRVTNATDPVGRNFTYVYAANNVDLSAILMTRNGKNEVQGSATYNSQHRPLTITDAAGQTTTNVFNTRGQLLSTTNPKGEITTLGHDPNGYLLTITGHLQATNDIITLTYDSFGRVNTVTDTEGYTLTFVYDAMDRKTSVIHPDGTFEQFIYTNLDMVASRDRLGRWTTNTYNADRQLVQTQDPLGRVTSFDWCKCGALTGLTDPMGRTTTWDYDVQSRPIAKHYVDGSTVTYVYENATSRLHSRFDEKGQQTLYEYYTDNNLENVSYPNATIATPTVTYTYDPNYNRVLTILDGIGTTIYTYNPITPIPAIGAGLLASVSGPLPNSLVTYQYDLLSRLVSRSIDGAIESVTYDVLDRPTIVTNALGLFQYSYINATDRIASEAYPSGQTNLYTYYNNLGDQRLQQIQHLYPNGSLLSGFGYAYNSVGQITAWTNQWDTLPTRVWTPAYDAADQLTNVISTGGILGVTNYAYAYDFTGNRLSVATNGTMNISSFNALNQLVVSSVPTNSTTYEWDAENRLTAINRGTSRSEFYYDGLGRRSQIIEKVNGNVVSNNFYVWCATELCEQRDSTGANVTKRFFHQGEQLVVFSPQLLLSNYFYTCDHMESIREALDSNGVLVVRYDYDPYGQQTVVEGNFTTAFAYTGDFLHTPSGLQLTLFRPLDTSLGRWIQRDLIAEFQRANLYAYVANNPINDVDTWGLSESATGGQITRGLSWLRTGAVATFSDIHDFYERHKDAFDAARDSVLDTWYKYNPDYQLRAQLLWGNPVVTPEVNWWGGLGNTLSLDAELGSTEVGSQLLGSVVGALGVAADNPSAFCNGLHVVVEYINGDHARNINDYAKRALEE